MVLAALASVVLLTGQDTIDPSFRTQVNVVAVPTTVLDRDGSYIAGLKPHEFRLFDNEKAQNIRVDETYAPVSLVVAIQADAKVEAVIPKIQKIGSMLQTLVAGDNGEVAIVAFDHRIQLLQDFTTDPDKISQALKKLSPGSSQSVLNDAVAEASRMLRTRPKERRRVVLLISESRDKGSGGRVREALTRIELDNVLVYVLNMSRLFTEFTAKSPVPRPDPIPPGARHVPAGAVNTPTTTAQMTGTQGYGADFVPMITEIFRSVKAVFVDNPVEIYTKYTGGKEFPFTTQKDLERAVQDVGREIHSQYLLTYSPSNTLEGGYHKIRVEVAKADLEVRTRGGYWMAAVK
jgi:VWFA-related protein